MLIPIAQWAEKVGIAPVTARQKAVRGTIPAKKMGRDWFIEADIPNTDSRIKSGDFKNWRKNRKITVSAEVSRSPNPQIDKDEAALPNNSTVYCGRAYTFVEAATYAEAIEMAKEKFAKHFENSEYRTDHYGAVNYTEEDESRKEYQIFVP